MGRNFETVANFIFLSFKITANSDCSHEIKRRLLLGRKAMTNLDSILERRDIILLTNVCVVKGMFFPVVMYGRESWTIKNAECWRTDAFELWGWRILKISFNSKEIKPVNSKGNQPWTFIGRTDAEAKVPILGPPDTKSRLTGKDPDAGKDWWPKEKGKTEDEIVGWHYWINGKEFEQTLGDSEWQKSLVCCSLWGRKEMNTT